MDLTRVFRIDPTGTPAEENRGERERRRRVPTKTRRRGGLGKDQRRITRERERKECKLRQEGGKTSETFGHMFARREEPRDSKVMNMVMG